MEKQETILIADDQAINRAILRSLFESDYNVLEAENGEQTLVLLRQYSESIAVILLDLIMPVKGGYAVLEELRNAELLYQSPVVVITAEDSTDNRVRVFELGASDIIAKPFEPEVVKSRVRNIIELGRYRRRLEMLVEEQSARARESNAAVIDMLSSVIEYRSLESGQHIRRIRMFTKVLLEDVSVNYQEYCLDWRRIQLITDASSMHDIGKIAIPDSILNKPGKLTDEEFEIMKTHTVKGCEILAGLDRLQDREYLQYAYHICRYHHERWDGRGYPDGLKGNSIPICAQVVAIADCYDALTTDRVYKKAIPPSRAFSMILNGECGTFSPKILECFKNVRQSFVQLSQKYADALPSQLCQEAKPLPAAAPLWDLAENPLEQGQTKYFALLRYVDSTVMELDLNTGVYHVVYMQDHDFAALRSGSSFEDSIRNFAETAVHPDDRAEVLSLAHGYIKKFFEDGMSWQDRNYRVLERSTGIYVQCRASLLRTNLDNPRLRRALLVWHKEETALPLPSASLNVPGEATISNPVLDRLLGGVLKCRCNKDFTILQVSNSLLDLLGYSQQEISEQFQNSMTELILPADREKVFAQFREQRASGNALDLEYRLTTKDGRIVWVSDRCLITIENGVEVASGVLMDITRSRQAEDNLRLSLERHEIIMKQTKDVIFDWDIHTDEVYLSSTWDERYSREPMLGNVRTLMSNASHVHPADLPAFEELIKSMQAGVPYKEAEFRIVGQEGKYQWRRVRSTAQFDRDGKPTKAVGVIVDIDSQKRASAELEDRASRDALTKLFNRAAAQMRVEQHLSDCGQDDLSAMMVLDVDDFKRINDSKGHMFGDATLVELSERISALYRSEDTVARIGGDEFLVFMPNIRKEEVARQRAVSMLSALQELLVDNLYDVTVSCSIGVSFSHGNGAGFQTLFNQADRALYRAKASGKNQYMCYTDDMIDRAFASPTGATPNRRTQIDSDLAEQWNLPRLIIRAFELLYGAANFDQAVDSLLAFTGEHFSVSRVYIFESRQDLTHCSNTFEWCADGVSPQKDTLQEIAYAQGGHDYRTNFDHEGIFYCQNVKKLAGWERELFERQRVLSTLQLAIRDNGEFHGFVGFDDCRSRRLWTQEQIEALTFVGKLLSVFLLKNRAQTALTESVANLHSILDHQEVWLYVLDPATYQLRYLNRKTKALVPDAMLGLPCYEAFYHRDRPCDNCVLEQAKKTGQSTMEYYNPILKLWVLADASIVEWERQTAGLIACRDISHYKQPASTIEDSPSAYQG